MTDTVPPYQTHARAPADGSLRFRSVVLEADAVVEPISPVASLRRRPGRPRGSKTRITHGHLTADEFALLRAVTQGIDVAVAARQYLLWPGRLPERKALVALYRTLLRRIAAAASALPDTKIARQMASELLRHQRNRSSVLADLASDRAQNRGAGDVASPAPPSLDEFAERFEIGMFSEAELLELYKEEFAEQLHAIPVRDSDIPSCSAAAERIARVLNAIDWLDQHLVAKPDRSQYVDQWVRLTLRQRVALREVGVITLGNLVDWMSLRGKRWYRGLPGFGEVRATALWQWLQRWSIAPALGLQPVERPNRLPALAQDTAPLIRMSWPSELDGADGRFRSPLPNALDAHNDQQAVQAWFALICGKSCATQTAYRRAIERLVLWAVHERGIALSSLSQTNMLEFRQFLTDPPPHWIQTPHAERLKTASAWRPLRGSLNEQSLRLTFAAINAMYEHWRESDYVTINPARRIQMRRDEVTVDVARSFTKSDLLIMADTLRAMPGGAARRRLRALLMLLEMTGLRREEVTTATWGDVTWAVVDGQRTEDRVLRVMGKGQRVRNVPLNAQIVQALLEHRSDRQQLVGNGVLKRFLDVKETAEPLVGVLDDRAVGPSVYELEGAPNGALSASSIYRVLKDFWAKCSVAAGEDPDDPNTTFKRASPHWLRHTCAHKLLHATAKDLPLVQAILGHKSITTTAIYVKADMADRIAATKQLSSTL